MRSQIDLTTINILRQIKIVKKKYLYKYYLKSIGVPSLCFIWSTVYFSAHCMEATWTFAVWVRKSTYVPYFDRVYKKNRGSYR